MNGVNRDVITERCLAAGWGSPERETVRIVLFCTLWCERALEKAGTKNYPLFGGGESSTNRLRFLCHGNLSTRIYLCDDLSMGLFHRGRNPMEQLSSRNLPTRTLVGAQSSVAII